MIKFSSSFILHFISLLVFVFVSNAQTSIKGKITDNSKNTIPNGSVSLLQSTNNLTIDFSYSNSEGYYLIKTNKVGKLKLTFSALNYETQTFDIELTNDTKILEKNIILIYKPIELKEVIINNERPISIKKDTITILAKSFLQGNEQVVEDLLKKIPGINVSEDGTIKVGNQEVEKIMVEGDDFFEKGYKLVTKNMPVQPIEKIEVYQHYSNNKHLKGIENSDKIALNIKLKENYRRQWFGNIQLGYGLAYENRYEVRSNLMNFGKKDKYFFLTNLNNIGFDAMGDIDNLIKSIPNDETSNIGGNQSVNSLLFVGSLNSPNLKRKRINFNNAEMLSLNSIFSLSNKVKIKTLGFLNTDENDFYRNSNQSFSIGSTTFENYENFIGRNSKITGFGKIDLTYNISKIITFDYTIKFNKSTEKNRSDFIFNSDFFNERLQSNNQLFEQKFVLTNKFKSNKVLLISGRYINEKTPQIYTANQFLYQDLFNQNATSTLQNSENRMQFTGFDIHLLDRKKNGDLFEISIGNQFRKDKLISRFLLKNNETVVSEPLDYQNDLFYSTNDLFFCGKYHFKFKKISLLTQADFHLLFNKLNNLEIIKSQNPLFINPKLALEWVINKKSKAYTSYSLNKTNATIIDSYTNYIQTSFRNFSKGTGEFNQLDSSTFLTNYNYGSWGDKFSLNTFILYSKNHDFFSTSTLVTQNYSQSEKIVVKDRAFITISSNIDRYFKYISSNLKLTFGSSEFTYKNIVNNSNLREVKSNSVNYGLELRSGFKGFFNYHVGSKWSQFKIKTTTTNSYTDNLTFLDLSFLINNKINFQLQTERYFFGNLDQKNNKYYFLDLEARYTVKENKLTFFLSGNNLFNTKTFNNYSISEISISKTEYRLQPRYVLLKMEYRF